ncbi:hypothetical protein LPJ74_001777 [Coemansia sp. RSA 1843]|nr:hypothetical protein LPJ74_001777 [Coemansia sp. RSA 1843]
MTGEHYAHSGSPETPHGTASDQHSSASGAANASNAATGKSALSYSALLNSSHHYHQQKQQQQQQRRRLSNAPSDSTDGRVHAGPVHLAGSDDQDDTSEDEIESLKRAMGSDQWALQRQRMRREQMNRPHPGSSNTPNSPATQTDASSAFMGKTTAPPAAASSIVAPAHSGTPHTHHPQRMHYSSHTGFQHAYPLPQELSPPAPQVVGFSRYTRPQVDANAPAQSSYASPSYASHPQQQQQHHPVPVQHTQHGSYVPNAGSHSSSSYIYPAAASVQYQQYGQYSSQQQQQHNLPHGSQSFQPEFGPQSMQPQAAETAAAAVAAAATSQQWPTTNYPPVLSATAESSTARYESTSAWSNDQMSASQTDASGFSQAHRLPNQAPFGAGAPFDHHSGSNASTADHYMRLAQERGSSYSSQSHFQQQQQQSPTLAHTNPAGYTATGSPPMEQKRPADNAPAWYSSSGDGMAERNHRQQRQEMTQGAASTTMQHIDTNKDGIVVGTDSPASAAAISNAFSTDVAVSISSAHGGHVIGAGSIGTYPGESGYRISYPQHAQVAESSAASTHLRSQEMQEQRQSPSIGQTAGRRTDLELSADNAAVPASDAGAAMVPASSAITIQSLLNSPLEEQASSAGTGRGRRSIDATSELSTISEHIAKENARFRQNSNASSHLPTILPRVQQPPTPTAAPQDSGPDSRSSYHSAGYSLWNGYAETVNQDFATAQQSFSSMEGPGLGVSMPPVDSGSGVSAEYGTSASNSARNAATIAADAATTAGSVSRGAPLGPASYPHPVPVPAIPASLVASMAAAGSVLASIPGVSADAVLDGANATGISEAQDGLENRRPSESQPHGEREFGFAFYNNFERRLKKPVSIMVQVGDDSQIGSDEGSESEKASLSNFSQARESDNGAAVPVEPKQDGITSSARSTGRGSPSLSEGSDDVGSMASFGDNPFASTQQPGRKATMESLDNVLEYYRTHPGTDSPPAGVEVSSADTMSSLELPCVQPFPALASNADKAISPPVPSRNPFESLKGSQHRPQLGSSRAPARDAQASPVYQRTSFSSPVVKPHSRREDMADSELQPPSQTDKSATSNAVAENRTAEDSASAGDRAQKDLDLDERQPLISDKAASPGVHVSAASTAAPLDSSVRGSNLHSREATPIEMSAEGSARNGTPDRASDSGMQGNEHLFSARRWHIDVPVTDPAPKAWLPHHPPPRYHDIYDQLEDSSDLEELVLPPTSAALDPSRKAPKGPRSMAGYDRGMFSMGKSVLERLEDSDEDCVVQMESIDGISELSDILDIATTHDSDFGYTNSNNSTDSFGEPIEHEAGILSKSLLVPNQSQLRQRSAVRRVAGEDMVDLGSGFARINLAPMTIHQLNSSAFAPPVPPAAPQGVSQNRPGNTHTASNVHGYSNFDRRDVDQELRDTLHSGRTNTSTLTTSTALGDSSMPAVSVAETTSTPAAEASTVAAAAAAGASMVGNQGGADKAAQGANASTISSAPVATGTTIAASEPAKQADNFGPLEIMEHASELEISLAREQEDYFSDNVSPANLDPVILQNLGKAVHHQTLLQRQHQLQRRKSNMHLGLGAAGGNDDHNNSAETTIVDPQYDDYEQALRAMLVEVSQYFTQSGLCFVFPFSAKWVEWLTRHPDRPFPWRKDPEDEDELGAGRGRRGRGRNGENDDEGEFSETQSDVSSFSEELLVLSRPLPPEDVLAKATIPMSTRRPVLVKDFVSQEKRKGINAHWQYYSVINQIVAVASGIHCKLLVPVAEADHSFVAHQLAALYQFLGGEFKKYKPHIESVFDVVKRGLEDSTAKEPAEKAKDRNAADGNGVSADADASNAGATDEKSEQPVRKVLDKGCAHVLREMMASIITDALYSTSKIILPKEQATPGSPTGAVRAKPDHQAQVQAQDQPQPQPQTSREVNYAISTLKGLPTQPIVRYLNKEMRIANYNDHQRRRRGLAHNLSRNNSMGHLRHQQFLQQQQQQQPPVPPLPHQITATQYGTTVAVGDINNDSNNVVAGGNNTSSVSNNNQGNAASAYAHEITWYEQTAKARRDPIKQTPAVVKHGAAVTATKGHEFATMLQPILSGDDTLEQQQQQQQQQH